MTYNEKKRYLEEYSYALRKIKRLNRQLEEWRTIATKATQTLSLTPIKGNNNKSKVEECAVRLENIESQILNELKAAEQSRELISQSIGSIKDTRRREIIEMRYLYGMSVNRIASEINKDPENIYKIIRRTVKALDI